MVIRLVNHLMINIIMITIKDVVKSMFNRMILNINIMMIKKNHSKMYYVDQLVFRISFNFEIWKYIVNIIDK